MIAAALALALALNPSVHPDTIAQTICRPGYTKTVRPSTSYVRIWKRLNLKAGVDPRSVVVDHHISIGLGGSPTNPHNLRIQPKEEAKVKDRDERRLERSVCKGELSLRQAQETLQRLWP
jgi:hypothetical protein